MADALQWVGLEQAAPVAGQTNALVNQGEQAGYTLGQQGAMYGALRDVDFNDPASTQNALQGLVHANALDQANAVQNLAYRRSQIGRVNAGIGALQDIYSGSSQAPQGAPAAGAAAPATTAPDQTTTPTDPVAAQRNAMAFQKFAADTLVNIKDPAQRQQAFQSIAQQAQEQGYSPQAVAAVQSHLSDDNALQSMSTSAEQWLDHPAFGGANAAAAPDISHPIAQTHLGSLGGVQGTLGDPRVQLALAQLASGGVDTKNIIESLKSGQGFTGVIPANESVAYMGHIVPGEQAPSGPITLSPGQQAVAGAGAPNQGAVIASAAPLHTMEKVGPAETPIAFNPATGEAGLIPAGGGAPSAGGATAGAAASGAQGASADDRGLRNNNPGNLKTLPAGTWAGQSGVDAQGFVQFATPQDGIAAADKNLLAKQTVHGLTTLDQIIAAPHVGWDPGNEAYAQSVAQAIGVKPTDPIDLRNPVTRHQVLGAIFGVENGLPSGPLVSQAGGGAPATDGAPPSGDGFLHGKTVSAPHPLPRYPSLGLVQTHPDGTITKLDGTGLSANDISGIRNTVSTNPAFQEAQTARASWNAMTKNAPYMTGPAAFAMLDTMVRTINPGAVARQGTLSAIQETFGLPDQALGWLQGKMGQGPLPTGLRQQLLDAAHSFVTSHYDQAKALNDNQVPLAQAFGQDPKLLQPELAPKPPRFIVDPSAMPPVSQRTAGQEIETPKGVFQWTGAKWLPVG